MRDSQKVHSEKGRIRVSPYARVELDLLLGWPYPNHWLTNSAIDMVWVKEE